VLKVYADNGSVVARIPGAHLVPKLRHKLGKYTLPLTAGDDIRGNMSGENMSVSCYRYILSHTIAIVLQVMVNELINNRRSLGKAHTSGEDCHALVLLLPVYRNRIGK